MPPTPRLPSFAAARPGPSALPGVGPLHTVRRHHCTYTVSARANRAIIWCRPRSTWAEKWMRAQGFDVRRMVCLYKELDPFIDDHEAAIEKDREPVFGPSTPPRGQAAWMEGIRRRP